MSNSLVSRIVSLYDKGYSIGDIAMTFDTSTEFIYTILKGEWVLQTLTPIWDDVGK